MRPAGAETPEALTAPSFGATIVIEATVSEDLQTIQGTLQLFGEPEGTMVEVLSRLPDPPDDRTAQRTFPITAERGVTRLREAMQAGDAQPFYTILPRRTGASGTVPGHGLFANGLWHPQPTVSGRLAEAEWLVRLHLPPGTTGVMNGTMGEGSVTWTGRAERIAIAVIPDARVQVIDLPRATLTLVDNGPSRPKRDSRLQEIAAMVSEVTDADQVLVQAPMLRRIIRPAPGMAFVSKRATRVTGRLWQLHRNAIRRGILAAHLPQRDPWARRLAAELLMDTLPSDPTAADHLRWVAWMPGIDSLLYDGSLPYMGEVMGETWPSDPIQDDLLEIVEGTSPPRVVARKIAGRYGESAATVMGQTLAGGDDLETAAGRADIPVDWLASWRPYPAPQNLRVRSARRKDGKRSVEIVRDAPDDAPPEPIRYRVGTEERVWQTQAGPGSMGFVYPSDQGRVVVDPNGDVLQTQRVDDASPPQWRPTFAAGLYEFNVNRARPSGIANAVFRRRYDTRWRYGAHLSTTPINLLQASTSVTREVGPLLDRRNRTVAVSLVPNFSWLDPDFQPTGPGGRYALGTQLAVAWDTRNGGGMPRTGHKLYGGTEIGWVLGSNQRWTALRTAAMGLIPVLPRVTLAVRGAGGIAGGGVKHRMISLGGTGAVQGLADNARLVAQAVTSAMEVRVVPIQHGSIPLPLAWLSHLQLSSGFEGGFGHRPTGTDTAVGWTAGIAAVADILGARPTMGGIWVADTLPQFTTVPNEDGWPEVYIRLQQSF